MVKLVLGSANPLVKGIMVDETRVQVILDISEGMTAASIVKLRQGAIALAKRALERPSPYTD
jgi:hypothetical protein